MKTAPDTVIEQAPRYLLCVDPGKQASGVALFRDRALVEARCIRVAATPGVAAQCALMTREIAVWCKAVVYRESPSAVRHHAEVNEVVVEWPQIYTRDKSKGDPNDLLPLAGVCAAVCTSFPLAMHCSYEPRPWKGTIDGDVLIRRIEDRLRETGELARVLEDIKTYRHNAVDACGIGLHHLGRLARRRVFPR